MALLVQAPLLAMVALINCLVIGVFTGPLWLAFVLSMLGLGIAWFCYLIYQGKHPDWWPPWDEGLPQEMRMMNAFVPVFIIYVMASFLMPVFIRAKEKAQRLQKPQTSATATPGSGKRPASVA